MIFFTHWQKDQENEEMKIWMNKLWKNVGL